MVGQANRMAAYVVAWSCALHPELSDDPTLESRTTEQGREVLVSLLLTVRAIHVADVDQRMQRKCGS